MVALNDLRQGMRRVAQRARIAAGRAVLALVDDASKRQLLQLERQFATVRDGVERFQDYGLHSVPRPGAAVAVVALAGSDGHLVALAVDDVRGRPTDGQEGDTFVWDFRGQRVWLSDDGIIIETDRKVSVTGARIEVSATDGIHLGAGPGVGVSFLPSLVRWHTQGIPSQTVAPIPPATR